MDARVQCKLLWERGGCLNVVTTSCYRDTYAHYWTWLDDRIVLSKHSLREGYLSGADRDRSRRGPLPENRADFDVRDSVDSRQNLSHDQAVESGPDLREVSSMFVQPWRRVEHNVLNVTLFSFLHPLIDQSSFLAAADHGKPPDRGRSPGLPAFSLHIRQFDRHYQLPAVGSTVPMEIRKRSPSWPPCTTRRGHLIYGGILRTGVSSR